MVLETKGLRDFVQRNWAATERADRLARARRTVDEKVRLGIEMYESMRRTLPDWPTETQRREDLEAHIRLRHLLDKATNVGSR